MAKVTFHCVIEGIRGTLDGFTFKRHGKNTIVTRRATHADTEWSPKVVAHRGRFRKAVEYGKQVDADPELREEYLKIREKQRKWTTPINAMAIGDYFHPPEIVEIDAGNYRGEAGDEITIYAVDDVGVASVEVVLMDEHGIVLEQGPARQAGRWHYKAKTHVPEGTLVRVEVRAKDRPGGVGTMEIEVAVQKHRPARPAWRKDRLARAGRTSPFTESGVLVRRYTTVAPDGRTREPVHGRLLE